MNELNELQVKWPLIVTEWDKIYFNYIDLGNFTMFRMCIFKTFIPRLGLYVSIEGKGSFFFATDKFLHKDYVAEKLLVHGDRGQIADFLNVQLQQDDGQQGHYYEEVIKDVDVYGTTSEKPVMPWSPKIIEK